MCLRRLVVFWWGGSCRKTRENHRKKPVGMFNKLKTYCRFNQSGHKGEEAEEENPPGTKPSNRLQPITGKNNSSRNQSSLLSLVASLVSPIQKKKVLSPLDK